MNKGIEISPYGSLLVYKKGYTGEFVRSTIRKRNLRGLRIFAILGEDRLSDLDFLRQYDFLKVLDINCGNDVDFKFLSHLTDLEELTITFPGQNSIDLTKSVKLKKLSLNWRKGKIRGLENCRNITSLSLIDYSESDFTAISSLRGLENLVVKTSSVKDMSGLEKLPELKSVLLANCKKLSSISEMQTLHKLTSVSFEMCNQIKNFGSLGNLRLLESLRIDDCEEIESIKFIEGLPLLKSFSMLETTSVLDGDLQPARNIKDVFYTPRRHYNIEIHNKEHDKRQNDNLSMIRRLFR